MPFVVKQGYDYTSCLVKQRDIGIKVTGSRQHVFRTTHFLRLSGHETIISGHGMGISVACTRNRAKIPTSALRLWYHVNTRPPFHGYVSGIF